MMCTSPNRQPAKTHGQLAPARVGAVLLACLAVCASSSAVAERSRQGYPAVQRQQMPAPIERKAPPLTTRPQQPANNNSLVVPNHPNQTQQHLAQWMDSHRSLPLAQQQKALEAEPGFRQLQPDVQMRMHDRLAQLNGMTPEKRDRVIARTEAMERLSPPQRQQVRSALSGLGTLPEERRRFVARTFRALREMPEPQRQAYLNSPQFRGQFSDYERATLNNLFTVAPYLPPPTRQQSQAPQYQQYPQMPPR